jgi:hypothetical protein
MNEKLEGLRRGILQSMGVSISGRCSAVVEGETCHACERRRKELATFEAEIRLDEQHILRELGGPK